MTVAVTFKLSWFMVEGRRGCSSLLFFNNDRCHVSLLQPIHHRPDLVHRMLVGGTLALLVTSNFLSGPRCPCLFKSAARASLCVGSATPAALRKIVPRRIDSNTSAGWPITCSQNSSHVQAHRRPLTDAESLGFGGSGKICPPVSLRGRKLAASDGNEPRKSDHG